MLERRKPMKFRKKPIVITALQYHKERVGDALEFVGNENMKYDERANEYFIITLEGLLFLSEGDYIIKGINGEFYPCKPDIFEKTYTEL